MRIKGYTSSDSHLSEFNTSSLCVDKPWGTFAPHSWRALWLRLLHTIPPGSNWRRLTIWLRRPLKNCLGPWVDLTIWNLRLRLRSRGNLSEQRLVFMPQHLDVIELAALNRELSNGGVFFDIGANAGVYSFWVASTYGPAVRIEAFEPDPELVASLRFNLSLNVHVKINLHCEALGGSQCMVTLAAGKNNKGENHVATATSLSAPPTGLRVSMTTLPAVLARENIPRIDALKIDVEGHEVAVLEPLFAETPRSVWPRLLICELAHDHDHGLAVLLFRHGYQLCARGRLNGIYRLTATV